MAVAQAGAREGGGETVFEVRFGAQLGNLPSGELALQEEAEALAKDEPSAATSELRTGAPAEIHEKEPALPFAEQLDGEAHPCRSVLVDRGYAAGQIAGSIPGLQGQTRAVHFKRKALGGQRKQFFAGLEQSRLTAVL